MSKKILVTRPEHDDTTYYLSNWSKKSLQLAQIKGIKVLDLHRERANGSEVAGMLEKQKPRLVVLNGHGSDNVVAGYKDEPLIIGGKNEELLKEKITYAISCRSARELGRKVIKSGGNTYFGYEDDFIFFYDPFMISRPLEDKTAGFFLEPATEIITSLLKGAKAGECSKKSKESFERNMHKLLSSEASKEDASLARYLWWNMRNQVCLGDENSSF